MNTAPRTNSEIASLAASEIRTLAGKLKRRLRELGGHADLTPSQTSVLLRLEAGPATVSGLARAESMRPQSMSAVIAALQEMGLVRGASDPSDGRQTLMSLTPKCLKWMQKSRTARQDWLAGTIAQRLSIREQGELRLALKLLARIVED